MTIPTRAVVVLVLVGGRKVRLAVVTVTAVLIIVWMVIAVIQLAVRIAGLAMLVEV
jgi:hypothetical protein